MFGAIEAGGTKMIVAVGDENGNIIREKEIKIKGQQGIKGSLLLAKLSR